MKKIILSIGVLIMLASCKKDLTSLNVNPKAPEIVPSYTLFSNAQLNLANLMASPNVNTNIWRLITQQWTETTYTDESNYDLTTRNIPQSWWHGMYRDVLKNLDASAKLIETDVEDAGQKKNELAAINILKVFTYFHLITVFGDIPYSEAMNISNTQPKYDDAKTAYAKMIASLDSSITNLNAANEGFGDADLLYGGDINLWKKFGNSLKLKMGMLMADYDAANAKTIVQQAITGGVFTSNDDNAEFHFLDAPPNTNPIWVDLVQSGRKDFVASSTIVDKMVSLNDPRVPLYFTKDKNGTYSGGINGKGNNYSTYSKPSEDITDPTFPVVFMDYAEVEFLIAEAIERGFTTGTAATHYNNAITASILSWGGTEASATTYLAQPSVAYATAAGNYKQKIGTQKWIALYNRGLDAWTEWRRLDYPVIVAPVDAVSPTPLRYTYPVSEQNLNKANYTAASTAIGGDKVTTKLWFDKF